MPVTDATAIVVAAGAGERLGAGRPKAYVRVAGEPLLLWSLRAFAQCRSVDRVVVVLPPEDTQDAPSLVRRAGFAEAQVAFCSGGTTRQASVSRGLEACRGVGVVAVHDAARPLVTVELIDRTVDALTPPWDGVAPGVPVDDTLKLVDETRQAVLRTVDRRGLWQVQTPQVFGRITLERVHARVASAADAATDDLSLVERAGGRVRLIRGDRRNFKVTMPADLALAEQLLAAGAAAPHDRTRSGGPPW